MICAGCTPFEEVKTMGTDPDKLVKERPANLDWIFSAPAEQMVEERFLLYSLVLGMKPDRVLEIGTHFGGTATVFCAALDDVGKGTIIGIDPNPLVPAATMEHISHRFEVLCGFSPALVQRASERAEGKFNFVLVDGDHSYEGVKRDVDGIMPHIAPGCCILFHDSHNLEIKRAIDEKAAQYDDVLTDCGELNSTVYFDQTAEPPIRWGGLRMLRFEPR